MSSFRDQVNDMDAAILDALGDDLLIEDRPVRGMFSAPFVGAKFGRTKTSLADPCAVIRDRDAVGIESGMRLTFNGEDYTIVRPEPNSTGWTELSLRLGYDERYHPGGN